MMPNFALHLSVDGIGLDHRAPHGWVSLGKVGFDTTDFAGDLAKLRALGDQAAPGGFATKLVLPNDQVKFLTLRDDAPTRQSIGMALEGATPYGIHELEFDWQVSGGKTHVAAVAKETLAEAESFAREHDFAPLAFACLPADAGWNGAEAFFGPVQGPGAVAVTRDPAPYVVVDKRAEPDPAPIAPMGEDAPVETTVQESAPSKPDTIDQDPSPTPADPTPTDPTPTDPTPIEPTPPTPTPQTPEPAASNPASPAPALSINAARHDPKPKPLGAAARSDTDSGDRTAPRLTIKTVAPNAPSSDAPALGSAQTVADADAASDALRPGAAKEPVTPVATARTGSKRTAMFGAKADAGNAPPTAASVDEPSNSGVSTKLASATAMFRSRRKPAQDESPAPQAAEATMKPAAGGFFAPPDRPRVGGKPRYMGLILTALLIVFLLAVAAWATVLSEDGFARLFEDQDPVQTAPDLPVSALALPDSEMVADGEVIDAITTVPLDAPTLETTPEAVTEIPARPAETDQELERAYAATGIWQLSPAPLTPPETLDISEFYVASIDRRIRDADAVALPALGKALDRRPPSQPAPAPFGTKFQISKDGLLLPGENGVLAPGGYTLFAGRPDFTPPLRVPQVQENAPAFDLTAIASTRPQTRPNGLAEANQRASLGGYTLAELAKYRPKLRPAAPKAEAEAEAVAEAEEAPEAPASVYAVATSSRPEARPKNFNRVVAKAKASQPSTVTKVAAIAPRTTRPSGPTRASVARAATTTKAINLRRVNLIGVYGKPSNRQALVRLANGRFVRVKVGDRVDGGKVAAIGESQLRYVKGGRNITLDMPS